MTQLSEVEFFVKASTLGIDAALFLIYCLWREGQSSGFLTSGQRDERRLLETGKTTILQLQQGAWRLNADKTTGFAAFNAGTLVLAAIFVFEQDLTSYDAYWFQLLLTIFAAAGIAYFVSLQFWFLAIEPGDDDWSRLRFRALATMFQTAGWFCMQIATVAAILTVSTLVGALVGLGSIAALIFVYEQKGRHSATYRAESRHR